jgi:energy-coupling factor transporter ATP-binding protein EcfA2
MPDDDKRITYFGATHTRGKREMFGIRAIDRGKHMYVIGKTGMGKSTMLENMAIQDIQNGEGMAFIDPHGSSAEKLLDFVPQERIKDVIYFAPFDVECPMGFNVIEDVGYDKRHLVVSGLMGAFKRIWVDAWSARMEYILQNTLLALLEYPDATLLDVNRMLTNKNFRAAVIEKITDPIVKEFWTVEFQTYTDRYTQEATPAIQNKVGQFVSNPLIRNIVGQPKSTFDLRKIMDEKKIFIVNLSKGRMGETNASLLGSMLTVKIYLAAMSRAEESAPRLARLPRFYFYVDEFQSMMNEAFADILSEARKYKLALTLANQYIEQMEEKVRDAVFGNVGTMIVFRVGPFDAEVLKTVFEPTFTAEDLVELGLGQIYLTLMIDGVGTTPFSAETIPPIEKPTISYKNDVLEHSRATFATLRSNIESKIVDRQMEHAPPPPKKKSDDFKGGDFRKRPGPPQGQSYQGQSSHHTSQSLSPRDRDRGERIERDRDHARDRERAQQASQHQPREVASPQHVPPVQSPSSATVSSKEELDRNGLRSAILSARPPTSTEKVRSPLEILREKQAQRGVRLSSPGSRPTPPSSVAAPGVPPAPVSGSDTGPKLQVPKEAPTPSQKGDPEVSSRDEISPEQLRSLLGTDNLQA